MPSDADILLGRIAVKLEYVKQTDVDACVRQQENLAMPRPLGYLMMENKLINQKELDNLLKIQNEHLQSPDARLRKKKEAVLFGKVVVKQKLASVEQVNECLRFQAQEENIAKSIGEVMVEKGYLKPQDVRKVLGAQKKVTMRCPKCKLSYTVVTSTNAKKVKCPKCKGLLVEHKRTAPVKTDAEFGTMITRSVEQQMEAKKPKAASNTKIATRCVICDHEFTGALDSTQRIRCPKCQSIFTPRRK